MFVVKRQFESETNMAGKCRIKVLVDNAQPFWMFVDFQECPRIIDVEQKIQQRCKNVNLKNLFLDGCVLPSNEPTELLRDNDVVHVEAKRCTYDPAESISIRTPKVDRKRKWAEVDGGQSDCEGESEKEKKYRERKGTKDSTCTETKNKKKSKKQKKLKERKKEEDAEEDDSLLVACDTHHPVTCEEDQSVSKQKNKQKERKVTDKKFSLADELPCVSEQHTSAASSEVHKKNGIKDNSETADAAEPVLAKTKSTTKSSNAADVNGSASTNKKRRKRKRKTAVQESTITLNSPGPATRTNIEPAPLRLPKEHQPRSKKLVFSSDEDSVVKESDEEDAEKGRDDDNGKPSEHAQIGSYSNSFTSFSESFPAVSSPFSNQTTEIKEGSGDAVNCGLATGMGQVKSTVEVTSAVGVNGYPAQANSSKRVNEENERHSDLQHQDQLAEEQSRKHKTASALEKSVTPVHQYTSGQHQVVHPNLAEYLKMSPEDRGVKLPPYVKAKRLSNGAMLYTRNPVAAVLEQIEHTDSQSHASSSPFKHPAVHCSEGASPREFGKQRQLNTVNTNKSIIIQNSPGTEEGAHRGGVRENRGVAEAGHCPSDQSCATRTDKDQVVVTVTPLYREYSLFPDLTAAPKVGDRIAYKVLEMGDDYTPGISDYKEAEVLDYDASCQSVTVRLLDNNMTLGKKKPGKFDLPEDERSEEEKVVTLELSSMFEPKLMSSA